jgi:tRNA(fMet)-specific endonuclease VapC
MDGVIDTSVFIYAERRNWTAQRTLIELERKLPNDSAFLSPIVLAELVHGIYRARTDQQAQTRTTFVEDIRKALSVLSFAETTAWIAGRIRGEQARLGNTLPLADALIAASALEAGYAVVTLNSKDFTRIPNLRVIPFSI